MLANDIFPTLIMLVQTESQLEVQVLLLESIYNVLRHGSAPHMPREAINCNALEALMKLCGSNVSKIREGAAKCIGMLWCVLILIACRVLKI